jgi:uncharacterized protein
LTGLFVVLWTWKCAMMVLFQNAIIYNPYLPPNSRTMTIEEYARRCRNIRWREEKIRSLDGTQISLVVSEDVLTKTKRPVSDDALKPVYILYFQG